MTGAADQFTVLVADDDPDDQLLIKDALSEVRPDARIEFVSDGVELLEFMRRQDRFADRIDDPLPRLVLLDLNMPVKDGREALFEIKSDPSFWRTPIIIFSTSTAQADIRRAYQLGANSFISKPSSFDRLVEIVRILDRYWFQTVALPSA